MIFHIDYLFRFNAPLVACLTGHEWSKADLAPPNELLDVRDEHGKRIGYVLDIDAPLEVGATVPVVFKEVEKEFPVDKFRYSDLQKINGSFD